MSPAEASCFEKWKKVADPFGIAAACYDVQYAWWTEPALLADRLLQLGAGHAELYNLGWRRLCHILYGMEVEDAFPAVQDDERFQEPIWTQNPGFDFLKESYLAHTRWLEDAIEQTPSVPLKTRRKAGFWVRQMLNALAPSNYFWTNPEAIFRWVTTGGQSALEGLRNFSSDMLRGDIRMVDEESFEVGRNLATTPGQVVFRNELLELIQYTPVKDQVHAIPVLIVSPWINKYYILDLNPGKSFVHYLVSQGFTVFITSWKNPTAEMSDTTLDDYMLHGVLEAAETVRAIAGAPHVHAVGYCIGGTLLAALMAWLNRTAKAMPIPIAHWTLLTTLVNFAQPGEIGVFIDETSVAHLERQMRAKGYLAGDQMVWSFRMLRSNSLIWHYVVHNYLYGDTPPPFDVLYWNLDSTRLPAAMHAFYLREFYLNNRLIKPDALTLGGRPIDIRLIKQPLYAVGTEQDHIAPWKETFKICSLLQAPVRYVLATSGHILGIVTPPVTPPKRRYWVGDASHETDPEAWRAGLEKKAGSWWEDWVNWLAKHCGSLTEPPPLGSKKYPVLEPAPGRYVLEK